jgi:hypothetical protein
LLKNLLKVPIPNFTKIHPAVTCRHTNRKTDMAKLTGTSVSVKWHVLFSTK